MKPIHVFVRVPPRIVQRIKAALRAENAERRERGLAPILLFGLPASVSLPQWFARAGEREAELTERGGGRVATGAEDLKGPAINVNFDVSAELAKRCLAALRELNRGLVGGERVCLRAGKPSLPQWFLRAGLRELQRQERKLKQSPTASEGA